jgi:hypothetical protein
MKNLKTLSQIVLEILMTECLIKMEKSNDPIYIDKEILLFREIEKECLKRREDNL